MALAQVVEGPTWSFIECGDRQGAFILQNHLLKIGTHARLIASGACAGSINAMLCTAAKDRSVEGKKGTENFEASSSDLGGTIFGARFTVVDRCAGTCAA